MERTEQLHSIHQKLDFRKLKVCTSIKCLYKRIAVKIMLNYLRSSCYNRTSHHSTVILYHCILPIVCFSMATEIELGSHDADKCSNTLLSS